MLNPAKKPVTYADLEAVPPHLVAEILGGELVTHPRPAPRHNIASSSLTSELAPPFQKGRGGSGGWIFADEPELHLGFDVVVPDIAGWRRERLTSMPDTAYFEIAPDWICEILSPSTERYDRGIKRRIYAEAGVQYLWLVNPHEQVLEAFKLMGKDWLLIGTVIAGQEVSIEPFNAISFPLSVLFPFDPPNNL
jgi:Uma2 family endonuclease